MAPSMTRIRSRSAAVSSSVASGRICGSVTWSRHPRRRGRWGRSWRPPPVGRGRNAGAPRGIPPGRRPHSVRYPSEADRLAVRWTVLPPGAALPDYAGAVIEIEDVPPLRSPVLIAAFEGWNDAADAASSVVDHLARVWNARLVAAVDPEDFYDFQVNRPAVGADDSGMRRITWPSTQLSVCSPPGALRDVILLRGIEPNMRWRQFCAELLAASEELGAELVVTLGALLADTPHTRPIPVSGTASEPDIADRLKLEQSNYEGPTGIVGVFQDACTLADIPAVSFWAAVPHYVAQPPCPKATLALLGQIEDLLELSIPLADLPEEARAWERGVDELAEEDEEIGDYVRALEETRDTADLPEASGEAIAREFERYLKRRESDDD